MFLAIVAGPACAAERLALLIGNQSYNAKVGPLQNPHNDIRLIGAALRSLKFKITEIKDADYGAIDKAINRHIQAVRREGQGSISLVYYAGHGAANPDTKINYLIPVDVANAEDDELWTNSINLNRVVESLREQAPSATHYVVFDACRNELNLTHKGKRALTDRGFVPLAYTPGVMIAYATAPGKTATDAGAGAGIYAKALAEEIVKPGLEAVTMFRRVALRVNREIGQDPWMAASTLPEVYLAGEAAAPPPLVAPPPSQPQLGEASREWLQVDKRSTAELETFVRRHGSSPEADYARARIQELKQQQVAAATPPPAAKPAPAPVVEPAVGVFSSARAPLPLKPAEERALKPGDSFKECGTCPEMVVVPAGSFMMGSPPGEGGRGEGPQQQVTIARSFAVGKYEVTFAEWDACASAGGCKSNKRPSDAGWGRGKRPVIHIMWEDAKQYVAWISRTTGKTYRLLSEAEWEYAARAGTTTRYHFGDDVNDLCTYANLADQAARGDQGRHATRFAPCRDGYVHTAPVGSFQPNAFGLYDMHGNVSEWVEDCRHNDLVGAPTDGSAWTASCSEPLLRLTRGGSWNDHPVYLRSANRFAALPLLLPGPGDRGDYNTGFRLARTLMP
jgi:formylglycine-generating enzyme required for sulfatase activity/uncharacterized caspase-like protein